MKSQVLLLFLRQVAGRGQCGTIPYTGARIKKDDVKAGVKSIVLILKQYTKTALLIFAAILASSWLLCGILSGSGLPYFVVSVGGGSLLLARDLWRINLDDPKSCLAAFENNGFMIGPIVWVGFLLDYLMSLDGRIQL